MSPDEKFEEKRYEEEEEKLNSLVNKLSEDDRERIYTEGMVELWLNEDNLIGEFESFLFTSLFYSTAHLEARFV